jgi:hypothetical protein
MQLTGSWTIFSPSILISVSLLMTIPVVISGSVATSSITDLNYD